MNRKMIAAFLLALPLLISAADVKLSPGTGGWQGKGLTAKPDGSIAVKNLQYIFSRQSLLVDTGKKYRISGQFRSSGKTAGTVIFGVNVLDKQGRTIFSNEVNTVDGTETELAAGCLPEDRILKINNGGKWKPDMPYAQVAFQIDDSGKFSDLPNRRLSGFGILAVSKKDGWFEVQLKNKCGKTYPAGTKVRQHHSAGYLFAGGSHKLTADWQNFSGVIAGRSLNKSSFNQWWPGTAKAQIVILANANNAADSIMEFRNIVLEPVTE